MYLIDRSSNRISPLVQRSFSELNFREREHLQEWIANSPSCLGEELLIIQKEFNGFADTNERLDLLALDKQGNIVVIENKLDDAGKDVTWQVIKYASYCSTLTKDQLTKIYQDFLNRQATSADAEQNLIEFYGVSDLAEIDLNSGLTQRIMMVAGNFRKEVTSTALWLINYKLRIQCFKVTPFQLGDQLVLNVEQVIPMKDAEDFIVSMAEKTHEGITDQETTKSRHHLRMDFWKEFLQVAENRNVDAFQNRSPGRDSWLSAASGMSGVSLNAVISKRYTRVEVYISRGQREANKAIFDELYRRKEQIEEKFGNKLVWERLDEGSDARIKFSTEGNYFEKDTWHSIIDFLLTNFVKLELAFKPEIAIVNRSIKNKS